ncbi:MAG TPA: response regulator [Bacillus sp. (in: firmicutes)]|jgi:DNA-binding NtrC family response regulator|nr:response regulator [Bacillus sp. (in: firmicutes)]
MARRVLLVDDELDIVYLVKVGLERKGFEVDSYVDPILALQNFKRGTYQLLILDIKMPKMNGLDFLDKIKKEDDKIKVCFFTASEEFASNYKHVFKNSQDKFLFISKPISIPKMTKQIEQFLRL